MYMYMYMYLLEPGGGREVWALSSPPSMQCLRLTSCLMWWNAERNVLLFLLVAMYEIVLWRGTGKSSTHTCMYFPLQWRNVCVCVCVSLPYLLPPFPPSLPSLLPPFPPPSLPFFLSSLLPPFIHLSFLFYSSLSLRTSLPQCWRSSPVCWPGSVRGKLDSPHPVQEWEHGLKPQHVNIHDIVHLRFIPATYYARVSRSSKWWVMC